MNEIRLAEVSVPASAWETEYRRLRFAQIQRVYDQSPQRVDPDAIAEERARERPTVLGLLDTFRKAGDLEGLRGSLDSWSKTAGGRFGFKGPNGQMYLNQLTRDGSQFGFGTRLSQWMDPPSSDDVASQHIDELASFTADLRQQGSAAAVARAPFLLSWLWWVQDPDRWWTIWPSRESPLTQLGFLRSAYDPEAQGSRYLDYLHVCRSLGSDAETEQVLSWFADNPASVGLDESAVERCAKAAQLGDEPGREGYEENLQNISVVLADLGRIGKVLQDEISEVLGCPVRSGIPTPYWDAESRRLRRDAWVRWQPESGDLPTANLVLLVEADRVLVALNPYVAKNGLGFTAKAVEAIRRIVPEGIEETAWGYSQHTSGPIPPGFALFGRKIDQHEALDWARLRESVLATAEALKPLLESVQSLASDAGTELPSVAGSVESPYPQGLPGLAEEFRSSHPYPGSADSTQKAQRAAWADLLRSENLAALDYETFRRIYNSSVYGGTGPQAILNVTLRDSSEVDWERFLTTIDYLLWDTTDPLETRIDRVLNDSDLGFRGFKDAVIMKLLAICHPDRVLPVFPYTGERGKARLLKTLGQPSPPLTAPAGQRHLEANDTLRALTEPLFPEDAWGQAQFLYWLLDRQAESADPPPVQEVDLLEEAAKELLLRPEFIRDIRDLLEETKQVIFYGPPGTGKTYVAQKLAEVLAGDQARTMLVQFHPSTSYEDFFEGYRPVPAANGQVTYALQEDP